MSWLRHKKKQHRNPTEGRMQATVTARDGTVHDVALRVGHITDDGTTVMVGDLPFPVSDLSNAWVNVIPPRTTVEFRSETGAF